MKAAVLSQYGTLPKYGEFADPIPNAGEQLLYLKAASIKNIDKIMAKGAHYDRFKLLPAVVGVDGVGVLEDGRRVYAGQSGGFMAEKVAISNFRYILLPDNVNDITAAALPNPALSAWFSLSYRAAIQAGDTVYINGATGVTGKIAIQLAKYLGAGKVIASGRNPEILETLSDLGADEIVSLAQSEDNIKTTIKKKLAQNPFDIVIDYTWGRPAELLLETLTGNDLHSAAHKTRFVSVGEMAGSAIQLSSATLRSAAIELYGVGGGSIPKEIMQQVPGHTLPLLFELAAKGILKVDTEVVQFKDIETAWSKNAPGKRLVVRIQNQ